MNFLGLDIGTTACKCQLFSEDGTILSYKIKEYKLLHEDDKFYIDIKAVWQNVKEMLMRFFFFTIFILYKLIRKNYLIKNS